MNQFLRSVSQSESYVLRDTCVIIDANDAMNWFVKSKLMRSSNDAMDKFGFNIVMYAKFVQYFFALLLNNNVLPTVVYNGTRLSESQYGPMVSKADHLEKSSRISHLLLMRGRLNKHDIVPSIAVNVLKRVVGKLVASGAPVRQVQAANESHGVLEKLANELRCPILTSHADFLLADLRRGFMKLDDLVIPLIRPDLLRSSLPTHTQPIPQAIAGTLYCNTDFFNANKLHGPVMKALWVLMRPDFSGRYFNHLNSMFELRGAEAFIEDDNKFHDNPRRRRPFSSPYDRLRAVINRWPSLRITDIGTLCRRLGRLDQQMLRDFQAIYDSFTNTSEIDLPGNFDCNDILKNRDASASFLGDLLMSQTVFNRGTIEDKETYRSTFSIIDRIRMYIYQRAFAKATGQVRLLDRTQDSLAIRYAMPLLRQLNEEHIYELFHFPRQILTRADLQNLIQPIRIRTAFKSDYFEQVFVVLKLVRSSLLLAWKRSHSNDISSPEDALAVKYKKLEPSFLRAVYNSVIYYLYKDHLNDAFDLVALDRDPDLVQDPKAQPQREGFHSELRLAQEEINEKIYKKTNYYSEPNYFPIKHMVELMNQTLHGYCEMNAISNYSSVRLALDEYYDATLAYKITSHILSLKSDSKSSLLELNQDFKDILFQ